VHIYLATSQGPAYSVTCPAGDSWQYLPGG
jgi:hypothetical protein